MEGDAMSTTTLVLTRLIRHLIDYFLELPKVLKNTCLPCQKSEGKLSSTIASFKKRN